MRFVFIGTAAGFHFQTTVIYFHLIRDNAMQSVWVALILSPNKRTSASHLKRENIQFKEMKEQRKNLVTLNTNMKTITLKIVNQSLARMLMEKFCLDTNPQGITKIHSITLEEHSCGFVYTKLSISID